MALTLTSKEIAELTGKQRPTAQARVLDALGYPYKQRPDGTLIVLRSMVDATEKEEPESPALRLS